MTLHKEHTEFIAAFPAALRDLIHAEAAAGNAITETGTSDPAPPNGAWVMLSGPVTIRPRNDGGGLRFFERQSPHHSGEFFDAERRCFVLEPPVEYIPPDMDAIRAELAARERASDQESWDTTYR